MWPPHGSDVSSDDEREPPAPSSDQEDEPAGQQPAAPPLAWLDLSAVGHRRSVAVSSIPGGEPTFSLTADLDRLSALGFSVLISLCTPAELLKLELSQLGAECAQHGIALWQQPVLEGEVPETADLMQLLEAVAAALADGGRVLLACGSGLGRICTLAACLMLHADEELSADQAVERVRRLRGPRAVQSVRQYNYIHEFREDRDALLEEQAVPQSRPVSR